MSASLHRPWRRLVRPGRRLRSYDWPLLAAVLVTIAFGTAMIYSATLRSPVTSAWDDLVVKQLTFALIGLVIMALLSVTEYVILLDAWPWIYGVTVMGLAGVLVVGHEALGSQRWFSTGLMDIQPAELAKVSMVLCLAGFCERFDMTRLRSVLASLGLVAVPVVLVLMQPSLATAIIVLAIWLAIVVAAGARPLHLSLLLLAATLLSTPLAAFAMRVELLRGYHFQRIVGWLYPASDPLRAGFQHIQTLIAVGNGGLTGTGFASGQQSQGGWLPLLHTDNVFALVAEEIGFVGGLALLLLLAFIVLRIARGASLAQDRAAALIAVGIWAYFLVQVFVNIGVVEQLLPVTGVSLPFVSYGGSSLVALLSGIGLVQSTLLRRKSIDFAS